MKPKYKICVHCRQWWNVSVLWDILHPDCEFVCPDCEERAKKRLMGGNKVGKRASVV